MGAILRFATTKALAGGNRFFTTLSLIGLAFKLARKLSGNAPKVLYSHKLKPGEALVVSDVKTRK